MLFKSARMEQIRHESFNVRLYISRYFRQSFERKTTYMNFCFLSAVGSSSEIRFMLKGKNLYLQEQILSFKTTHIREDGKRNLAEWLPFKGSDGHP